MRSSFVSPVIALALLLGLYPAGSIAATATANLTPIFDTATWLDGRAGARDLRGKVVVVAVFTFECINCTRVTPNLRALWNARTSDLAILGVHTPEVPAYQSRPAYLTSMIRRNAIG